jgi:hypothetical protein
LAAPDFPTDREVEGVVSIDMLLPNEQAARAGAGSLAHALGDIRVREQENDCARQRPAVFTRHEEAGFFVRDNFGQSADARRHYGTGHQGGL